jgi:hypothetical protein
MLQISVVAVVVVVVIVIIINIIIIILPSSSLSYHHHFSQVSSPLERTENPTTHTVNTFLITCDVPSTAVPCRQSIKCFPAFVYRFVFSPLVTIPGAPTNTGMTMHFIFYFGKFLYLYLYILIHFQPPL